MAFNALKATMVEYDTTGMTVTTPDGTVVSGGASRAEAITTTKTDYAPARDDDTLQFCEQYFSDLTLDNTSGDSLGRTANIWALDDETIGTYPAGAAFTYTASVNATNMRNTLRSYNLDNVVVVTNGEPAAAAALTTAQVARPDRQRRGGLHLYRRPYRGEDRRGQLLSGPGHLGQ